MGTCEMHKDQRSKGRHPGQRIKTCLLKAQAVANKCKMTRRGLWLSKINWLEDIECYGRTVLESFGERTMVVDAQVALKPNELSIHHSPYLGEASWSELFPSLQRGSNLVRDAAVKFFLRIRTFSRRGHY